MRILAVGAHLDDIELACGGTLAKAIKNGHEVKCIIMSKSGYTNVNGVQQRIDSVAIEEGKNALHCLGVSDIEIFDFPTKDIPFESKTVETIDRVIQGYNPDLIIAHHPFDTHQAHVGVSQSTIAAARRHNNILFFEPIAPSGRSYVAFKPQVYVDISDDIEVKLNSLKEHKTEYNKFGGENWINGVMARAGFRGYEMGKKYAECFEVLRMDMKI